MERFCPENVSTTCYRPSGPVIADGHNERDRPDIGPGWYEPLADEFASERFALLKEFLIDERKRHVIYPKARDIFAAFNHTPFDEVRVVLLGQDPYHGPGQAHGLCFSVPEGVPAPPSLQNMFKEIERDLHVPRPSNGSLVPWAEQGVLLMNATLTVRAGAAGSHQGRGWEEFTDTVIKAVSAAHTGVIFLLWGRYAQQKAGLVDPDRHYVLKAPHPSPLSAHRGFIGCGHFSKVNELLEAQGKTVIDW